MAVSPELISKVTDAVLEECLESQNRPLERIYAILYLDTIHVKIRDAGAVDMRAMCLALVVDEDGCKHMVGMWIGENETAKFWLSVLNDLKVRGLQDALIAVMDGLKGFAEALETAFPKTTVQTCICCVIR